MSKEAEALIVCKNKLKGSIREPIIQGFKYIYSIAEKRAANEENSIFDIFGKRNMVLYNFQEHLKSIITWNQEAINKETNRLTLAAPNIKALMHAICVALAKMLSNIKISEESEEVHTLTLPHLTDFVHKIYEKTAKNIYTNPHIFLKNVSLEQKRKNDETLIEYIDNGIDVAIIDILPTQIIDQLLMADSKDIGSDIDSLYTALSDRRVSRRTSAGTFVSDEEKDEDEDDDDDDDEVMRRKSSIGSVFSRRYSNNSTGDKSVEWLPQNNFKEEDVYRNEEEEDDDEKEPNMNIWRSFKDIDNDDKQSTISEKHDSPFEDNSSTVSEEHDNKLSPFEDNSSTVSEKQNSPFEDNHSNISEIKNSPFEDNHSNISEEQNSPFEDKEETVKTYDMSKMLIEGDDEKEELETGFNFSLNGFKKNISTS